MITQIEIDGFKTFKDFKVELSPFQVIVGANGSGKSNLFDALQLLERLAEMNVREAFQSLRGEADEVFMNSTAKNPTRKIRIAVEMFVNPTVKDSLGREEILQTRRLRYEVEVERGVDEHNFGNLEVTFESLTPIHPIKDKWSQTYIPSLLEDSLITESPKEVFMFSRLVSLSSSSDLFPNHTFVMNFHADGRGIETSLEVVNGTALRGVTNTEYPHVFAAGEELRSLQFFHFNPTALRQPSSTRSPQTLASDGKNIASTLFRMQKEDRFALGYVSRDMANLVPGILKIRIERDKIGDRYMIYAEMTDKRVFSSQVLSDGTLRLLALATLKNDPQFHGILCLEEPENGVSPLHMETMARLLRKMATDVQDAKNLKGPLRQVLITTHSPLFISQPDVIGALLLAFVPTHIRENASPMRVTRMAPVMTSEALSHLENVSRDDKAIGAYTTNMLLDYLDSELLEEAREQLEKGNRELNER
jgi:predicted ATPase